jgi:hypothetical protein
MLQFGHMSIVSMVPTLVLETMLHLDAYQHASLAHKDSRNASSELPFHIMRQLLQVICSQCKHPRMSMRRQVELTSLSMN